MVLPANNVTIKTEEMMHLDGGFGVPKWPVYMAINAGLAVLIGRSGIKLLMPFIRRNGSAVARKTFNNVLIRFVSTRVANTVTGLVLGAINGFLSFSVGAVVTTFKVDDHAIYFIGFTNYFVAFYLLQIH